jgi:lipoprotein-releasing system permease protein
MMAMRSCFQGELIKSSIENNPHIGINPQSEEDLIRLYRYISARIAEKEGVVAVFPESA